MFCTTFSCRQWRIWSITCVKYVAKFFVVQQTLGQCYNKCQITAPDLVDGENNATWVFGSFIETLDSGDLTYISNIARINRKVCQILLFTNRKEMISNTRKRPSYKKPWTERFGLGLIHGYGQCFAYPHRIYVSTAPSENNLNIPRSANNLFVFWKNK